MQIPKSEIESFFRGDPPAEWPALDGLIYDLEPLQALTTIEDLCRHAPDDHGLCWLGTHLLEPLIDLHWAQLGTHLLLRLRANRTLRRSFSCVSLSAVPDEAVLELDRILEDADRI